MYTYSYIHTDNDCDFVLSVIDPEERRNISLPDDNGSPSRKKTPQVIYTLCSRRVCKDSIEQVEGSLVYMQDTGCKIEFPIWPNCIACS